MPIEASTTIALSLGQVVALAATLGTTLIGAIWGVLKVAFHQFEVRIQRHVGSIEQEASAWRDLERSFLNLRAELPEKYVRREDYIRGQTVIEAKLDAIATELKLVQIQGAKSAER